MAQARIKEGGALQTEIDIGHGLLNEIEDSMKAIQEALEYADVIKILACAILSKILLSI
jgi:hypothetical protein